MASTVTVFSNGYVYPQEKSNGYGSISSSGLWGWVDTQGFTRVFFCPMATGELTVAVSAKAPSNGNTLQLLLNGAGEGLDVDVPLSSAFTTLDAGTFHVAVAGQYHFVEIRAVTKNGAYLPDVEALVLSGPAAAGLKLNESQYRSAPSTHLTYQADASVAVTDVAWFYNEVSVPLGADPLNAYFMSNGFDGGYFGIQVNSATERRVLFSIWSNYNTDDPSEIPADYAVTLVKKGSDVYSGSFGNEGSGGQSYWKFTWQAETTYRLLVHAVSSGDHTIYTGYFYMPESGTWKLIAQWDKAKTGGALLTGLYSFVENFGGNGNDYFEARYSNQWVCTIDGSWVELPVASFSTTANPTTHQRYDYGAGVHGHRMYMYSGGFRDSVNIESGEYVRRAPGGIPPSIDFSTLPEN